MNDAAGRLERPGQAGWTASCKREVRLHSGRSLGSTFSAAPAVPWAGKRGDQLGACGTDEGGGIADAQAGDQLAVAGGTWGWVVEGKSGLLTRPGEGRHGVGREGLARGDQPTTLKLRRPISIVRSEGWRLSWVEPRASCAARLRCVPSQ